MDFQPLAGTLTFGAGVSSQLIPLVIVKDVIAEGPETFTIQLSDPLPLGLLKLGPEPVKVFTIADDDFGGSNVRFDAPAYSGDGGQTVSLTVRRDGGHGTTLTVSWRAVGGNALAGTDFSPAQGTVTFASTASAATFQITLATDTVVEGPEFALLALSVPPGAALLGEQSTATLTIVDRTPPPIQFESATYSVLETAGVAAISLVREGSLDQAASVPTRRSQAAPPPPWTTPVRRGLSPSRRGGERALRGPGHPDLAWGSRDDQPRAQPVGGLRWGRATTVLTIVDTRCHPSGIAAISDDGFGASRCRSNDTSSGGLRGHARRRDRNPDAMSLSCWPSGPH